MGLDIDRRIIVVHNYIVVTLYILVLMYAYRSRWDGVSIHLNVERFGMNTYNILSTYTFSTCIKHILSLT